MDKGQGTIDKGQGTIDNRQGTRDLIIRGFCKDPFIAKHLICEAIKFSIAEGIKFERFQDVQT